MDEFNLKKGFSKMKFENHLKDAVNVINANETETSVLLFIFKS